MASCGPTVEKAKKNLEEAVEIVVKGAAEDGNLKDLLLESGFEIGKSKLKPPKVSLDKITLKLDPEQSRQVWLA